MFIRGRRTLALACRRPSGEIFRYREPLDSPLHRSRMAKLPLVRGVIVLGESLTHGYRMLQKSADIQLEEEGGGLSGPANTAILVVTALVALGVFVGIPYVASGFLHAVIQSAVWSNIAEGILRLVLFLGYMLAIAQMPDIKRVFRYHGAEHMAIHAHEAGEPLEVDRVRPFPTAHPRCGTAFLMIVAVIAIALFAFLPRANPVIDLVVRLALVVPVAAISYEVLKLGAQHLDHPVLRALVAPGILMQRVTTRRPDDGMIEVAIASLSEALAGDAEAVPA
ncbi:MAG: DUF1385 domain-containing protein [Chloroflexi bacterium]|nr:DUF1385 domain-containing protein [Chloroflexota bacterium]